MLAPMPSLKWYNTMADPSPLRASLNQLLISTIFACNLQQTHSCNLQSQKQIQYSQSGNRAKGHIAHSFYVPPFPKRPLPSTHVAWGVLNMIDAGTVTIRPFFTLCP